MRRYLHLTVFVGCLALCQPFKAMAQPAWQQQATIIRVTSSYTAFPDEKRQHGYTYDGKFFDSLHYADNTVLMIVPEALQKLDKVDLVFWFHGWYNNIDTAMDYYHLAEQFIQSGSKAVLVLAETGKNVPDSYGGKLEQPNMFAGLVNDISDALKTKQVISKKGSINNIILAGHSGAYRIIAYILQNGGVPVHEVELFDALYGQTDKYIDWIQKNTTNRFVHWYTSQGGGTDVVSVQAMDTLKAKNIPFIASEETAIGSSDIHGNRVLFIHSARKHNDVIFNPDSFQLLLEQSPWLRRAQPGRLRQAQSDK
jgi:hypothetical protein